MESNYPSSTPSGSSATREITNEGSSAIRQIDTGFLHYHGSEDKEGGFTDWHIEGAGKRVGYDNLTAIDWIFEYTKERQRLRELLAGSKGIQGYAKQILDASHVWVVLVFTGLFVGIVAATITIASDWLGDIKTGYCRKGHGGGQFYLNKQFCCWGHDEFAQCQDWTPWRIALHIPSVAGSFVVEYIFFVIFSVLFAASAAVLVKHYSIYARHSGIPEIKTMLGGFVIRRYLGGWTLATKSVGLCLAVASGLWLGKEGPLIHVACCCANVIMKPFHSLSNNEARKREILSAASASGIAVAFGAPIGGVLFSLEQLSYYFPDKTMWQSFVCAMIAAFTLQAINPFHTGKIVLYQVTYTTGWHSFEIVPFIALGITGGIFGGLFIKLNMAIAKMRKSPNYPLANKPLLEVLIVALITALVNFPNIFMQAQLSELVYYLFAECATIGSNDIFGLCRVTTAGTVSMVVLLIAAAGLGFLLASMTFGLQIPAGIILPSLAIGALYGRALGVVVELIHKHRSDSVLFAACEPDVPCVTPGTYAIVGAASALAGVTRMTASIVVIMFELTGALTYVLPIMIAVMLAKWIGDVFTKRGIYESWIHLNEYPYIENRDDAVIPQVTVANVMTRCEEMTYIDAARQYSIADLRNMLKTNTFRGFPVIRTKTPSSADAASLLSASRVPNVLLGYISRAEMSFALEHAHLPGSVSGEALPATTLCFFMHSSTSDPRNSLDMRPWMDQTPITLHVSCSLHLAVSMFQKLGLRYLLFVDRGSFRGLLTKKDVYWVMNAAGASQKQQEFVPGTGVLREDNIQDDASESEEARGLLNTNG